MAMNDNSKSKVIVDNGPMGFVLFVAFIGACVYFMKDAQNFGDVIIGFFEAIVWPAILLYHVLQLVGA